MTKLTLPLGMSDFREIRESNRYYIDKTENISELIRDGASAIQFTRPRKFGRTAFLSTLRHFFDVREDSKDIFRGLAIMEDKEAVENWMNKYPVIYLSFGDIGGSSFEEALSKLSNKLSEVFKDYSFIEDSVSPEYKERFLRICSRGTAGIDIQQSLITLASALYEY